MNETIKTVAKEVEKVAELQRPEVSLPEEPETKTEPEKKVESQTEQNHGDWSLDSDDGVVDQGPVPVIPEPESEAEKGKPHGRELPRTFYQLGVQG